MKESRPCPGPDPESPCVGAISRLRIQDLRDNGNHRSLQFAEKGGKSREIPVRHDLDEWIAAYTSEGLASAKRPRPRRCFGPESAAPARSPIGQCRLWPCSRCSSAGCERPDGPAPGELSSAQRCLLWVSAPHGKLTT